MYFQRLNDQFIMIEVSVHQEGKTVLYVHNLYVTNMASVICKVTEVQGEIDKFTVV